PAPPAPHSDTLSLHDALPILSPALQPPPVVPASAPATEFSAGRAREHLRVLAEQPRPIGSAAHSRSREYVIRVLRDLGLEPGVQDRKSTRLNSSHVKISYAVF